MFSNNGRDGDHKLSTPVKVLVVDDSAFMRYTISSALNRNPGIHVVGSAHDGLEALDLIPKIQPDVITLDVEMPHLDGLSTLRQIMTRFPRPVIMLSSLTKDGAVETIQALTIGAVDFIAKPVSQSSVHSIMEEVAQKVLQAARVKSFRPLAPPTKTIVIQPSMTNLRPLVSADPIVVIGTSTGGPRALNELIPALPADLPAAVVIVQHMPAGFTRSLADRLDQLSTLSVKEAEPGDQLSLGRVLLAPGGFHMLIDATGRIGLNQNPPVHGVRPAVDVTLTSLVQRYGKRVIAVILTGMGSDGAHGSMLLHSMGGYVIAEHESSCVVYGMPRSVVESGAADAVVPLPEMAASIQQIILDHRKSAVD